LRLFEAVARHFGRAVRINRQLWKLELANLAATERIEMLPEGAMLVDASGRVVLANAAAKAMLDARDGMFLCDGHLAVAGSPDALLKLVASCARRSEGIGGPGGELKVPRDLPRSPLHVTVAMHAAGLIAPRRKDRGSHHAGRNERRETYNPSRGLDLRRIVRNDIHFSCKHFSRGDFAMTKEDDLHATID
jgi:hypothetical protein